MTVRIAMKQLLEAGAHFGHQTRRWNPKMAPFIFTKRKNIHIIDLQQTLSIFRDVVSKVIDMAGEGKQFLFVGTKKQAKDSVIKEAERSGSYYVSERWLGGMLTNHSTIAKSVDKLVRYEALEADGTVEKMGNKEAKQFRKELNRLRTLLTGIRNMKKLPDAIVIIDLKREITSVLEAKKLGIPVIGILDTNCDPEWVTWGIPGNDDAIRAISLYLKIIADAIGEGRQKYEEQLAMLEKADQEAREALESGKQLEEAVVLEANAAVATQVAASESEKTPAADTGTAVATAEPETSATPEPKQPATQSDETEPKQS